MPEDKDFDVRLVKHHIRRNVLDPKDLEKHLAALPDDAEHGEETTTRFESNRSEEAEELEN